MKYINIEELYKLYQKHPVISKDSRQIEKNCLYFALKGENFNGNKFASDSLEKGAAYAIVDEEKYAVSNRHILVNDVLETLQELAKHHRSKLQIPIIGITGSNGKTTNKELIAAVLSQKYNCFFTLGNYNNHIGVPLSILAIDDDHEIAVIEMGANHQGEIAFLSEISNPDYGIITNIGKAHLEGFGGVKGIKKGKSELYKHIYKNEGKIFINGDDEVLKELAGDLEKINFGKQQKFYCTGIITSSQPTISGSWKCESNKGDFNSQLYGEYNFYNILAAICIGNYFEVPANQIDQAINSYQSSNNRSQLIDKNGYRIFLDAYNANPTSMEAALSNFSATKAKNTMVILGDMFELGEESEAEHKAIIEKVNLLGFDKALFVGENFHSFHSEFPDQKFFKSFTEAIKWFKETQKEGYDILIKGSRGMKLEKLLEY
jgi:UDP-N-acetylmuramoyl-tripeptide--D-alanyl-D-alanine ligase